MESPLMTKKKIKHFNVQMVGKWRRYDTNVRKQQQLIQGAHLIQLTKAGKVPPFTKLLGRISYIKSQETT